MRATRSRSGGRIARTSTAGAGPRAASNSGPSLPRGTVLRAGDCFVLDDERRVVMVVERPEAVFVIEPRSAPEWALFAYHIGNRHQPLMITDQALVCPDVPGVDCCSSSTRCRTRERRCRSRPPRPWPHQH